LSLFQGSGTRDLKDLSVQAQTAQLNVSSVKGILCATSQAGESQ